MEKTATFDIVRINGWRQEVMPISVDIVSVDGPQYNEDVRKIEDTYGFDETYSYSDFMLDNE